MNLPNRIAAERILKLYRNRGEKVVTAESCTGGLVSGTLTDLPGISEIYWGGFVVYDNTAKTTLLGVPVEILNTFGAVSEETARAMATGALLKSGVKGSCVAITGIAGPTGGTPGKPVGTVCFGLAHTSGACLTETKIFCGDRNGIRQKAAHYALSLLIQFGKQGNT